MVSKHKSLRLQSKVGLLLNETENQIILLQYLDFYWPLHKERNQPKLALALHTQ